MGRSYGIDDEIDMSELDDELAAIDEQLSLEAEVLATARRYFASLVPNLAWQCNYI